MWPIEPDDPLRVVVSVEPNKMPAKELAGRLLSNFGPSVARKACARELFLATAEGNSDAERYWRLVDSELETLGAKLPMTAPRVDHATADEGILLNKVFVRIRSPESRRTLIEQAILALRDEPIEDQ